MNALITDTDLLTSARNLDPKRCWKQAIECKQMLLALLELDDRKYYCDMARRCSVSYWTGFEWWLAGFGSMCVEVSVERDSVNDQGGLGKWLRDIRRPYDFGGPGFRPWWLYLPDWFAHQRALLCSKAQHYRDLWPHVTPDPVRYYPVADKPGTFETRGD